MWRKEPWHTTRGILGMAKIIVLKKQYNTAQQENNKFMDKIISKSGIYNQ